MEQAKYLIIGGGLAGTTAADTIRQNDAAGKIIIVSEEPYPLYSRILLSKPAFFLGKMPFEQVWLKREDWYEKNKITLFKGRAATKLNKDEKIITLDDGSEIKYEKLLLAIGGHARAWNIPGADKKNIFYVRDLDDAKGLIEEIKSAKRAAVIGAGFVSFEMSDILSQGKLAVSLIIRENYFWEPILDEAGGKIVEAKMQASGVKIIKNALVKEVIGKEKVEGLVLENGEKIACDMVVVGIGADCPFTWLKEAGVEVNRAICANEYLETNVPDIWAAGDGVEYMNYTTGDRTQICTWNNAQMQGKAVGLNMTGKREPFRFVSFYTATGFGMNLAFVGQVRADSKEIVVRISGEDKYERLFIKNNKLFGGILINRNGDLPLVTKLISEQVDLSNKLADMKDSTKELNDIFPQSVPPALVSVKPTGVLPKIKEKLTQSLPSIKRTGLPANFAKIKVGWFSFSCSEDSTIVFTELMNEHWQEWKKMFDFKHARVLQSNNVMEKMDVAFIEGAIASDEQAEKLKEIRKLSTKLVAIGACAVTGLPSGQRNRFNEEQQKTIEPWRVRFNAAKVVRKVADVVAVDASVPGCPMDEKIFLSTVNNLVEELRSSAAKAPVVLED